MSKTLISTVYSDFKYGKTHSLSDILKTTKGWIVNSNSYKNYNRTYHLLSEKTCFKCPEVDEYPIIKNKLLTPLNKPQFKTSKERSKMRNKCGLTFDNFLLTSTNMISTTSRTKRNDRQVNIITDRTCSTGFDRNNSARFLYKINKEKIFLLRDIFFQDNSYSSLYYNEHDIFNKEEYHNSYINRTVLKYQKEIPDNLTKVIMKDFFQKGKPKANNATYIAPISSITLKSWTIEFKQVNELQGIKPILITIPFSYLPIIYYNNFANLKYILLAVIKLSNDFQKVEFDNEEWFNWIKTAKEFGMKSEKIISEKSRNSRGFNSDLDFESMEDWYCSTGIDKIVYDYKTNTYNNMTKASSSGTTSHGHMWSWYNTYRYIWITPDVKYKVEIRWPELTINVKKLRITKFINNELLLFLLENSFRNWDFYVVHYLFSLKLFRAIIENILSKKPEYLEGKEKYLKNNIFKSHFISVKKMADLELISWSKVKVKEISPMHKSWQFFSTESINKQNKNFWQIFHSYRVTVFNDEIHPKGEFVYFFSFTQMKIWNTVQKYQRLDDFINKILIATKESNTIKLDYTVLKSDDYQGVGWEKKLSVKTGYKCETVTSNKIINNCVNNQMNNSIMKRPRPCISQISTWKRSNKNITDIPESTASNMLNMKIITSKINNFDINIFPPYWEQVEYLPTKQSGILYERSSIKRDSNIDSHRNWTFDVLDTICNSLDNYWEWPTILSKFIMGNISSLTITCHSPIKRAFWNKNSSTIGGKKSSNNLRAALERGEYNNPNAHRYFSKNGNIYEKFKSLKNIVKSKHKLNGAFN